MGMQPCNCNLNIGGLYDGYSPMPRMSFGQNYFLNQASLFTGLSITNPGFTYPAMRSSYMADWFGAMTTNRYWAGSNGLLYAFDPSFPQQTADAARGFGINPVFKLQQGFQCTLATATFSLIYNVTTDKISKTLTCCHNAFDSVFQKDENGKVDYTAIKPEFKEKMSEEEQNKLIEIMAQANDIEAEVKELLAKPVSKENAKRLDEILGEVNKLFKQDGEADKLRKNIASYDEAIQNAKKEAEKTKKDADAAVKQDERDEDESSVSDKQAAAEGDEQAAAAKRNSSSLSDVAATAKEDITVKADGLSEETKKQLDKATTFIAQIADLDPKPKITTTQENNFIKHVIKLADGRSLVLREYADGKLEILVNFDTTRSLGDGNKRQDLIDVKYIIPGNDQKTYIYVDTDKNRKSFDKIVSNVSSDVTNNLIELISKIFDENQPPLSSYENGS